MSRDILVTNPSGQTVEVDAGRWEELKGRGFTLALEVAPAPELGEMTKAELVALAADQFGLELSERSTKAELIGSIGEARGAR